MKNFRNFLLITLLVAVGCDVLDQQPQTAISDEIAIRDQKSAQAALNGLYSQVQSTNYYGSNLQISGDVSADISQSIGTWDFYREMDTYVTSPGNTEVRNLWEQMYSAVNHANNIIAELPNVEDIPQTVRDQILGEAYFIRGLAFFDLTRTFGGVEGVYGEQGIPLVTTPSRQIDENSFPSRASIAESYQQVRVDLEQAETLLATAGFSTPNRASDASAKALLSRLDLYTEDFEGAEDYATEVIEDYSFDLVEDFANIFANENTVEAIFELTYNTTDGNDIRFWYFPSSGGGRGDIALHEDYVDMVHSRSDDERGDLIGFDANVGAYYSTKYAKAGGDDNIQVLRLAEMYLNRAEARTRKTPTDFAGALADLNEVRNRAGLADTLGAGVATASDILAAIEHERGIEFIQEGHRWFNLVRTGNALTTLNAIDRLNGDPVSLTNPGRQVFPIPSRDDDANENLDQNEAYQ